MQLPELIDRATQKAGSQVKLAELMGTQKPNITQWKNGKRTCSVEDRAALAAIAGIDVHKVIDDAILAKTKGTKRGEILAKALMTVLMVLGLSGTPQPAKANPPQCILC